MFQRLFDFVADGIANAVLRGFQKADAKITGHLDHNEPLTIETKVSDPTEKPAKRLPATNGKRK